MLDYTLAALNKTKSDLTRFQFIATVILQLFTIGYTVYAMIAGVGNTVLNAIMCAVSVAYLLFYLITYKNDGSTAKKSKKTVKSVHRWIRLSGQAVSLCITVYGIYSAATNITLFSLTLTFLMFISWILQLVLEVLKIVIISRFELFYSAIKADFEGVSRVTRNVGNFVRRVRGEELKPDAEPISEKHRTILEEQIEKDRQRKQNQKYQKASSFFSRFGNKRSDGNEEHAEYEDTVFSGKN